MMVLSWTALSSGTSSIDSAAQLHNEVSSIVLEATLKGRLAEITACGLTEVLLGVSRAS